MNKSREQFEAWLESEDGKALMAYSDNHTIAEAAWQASRAAVEIEHPEQDSYLGTRQVTFERDAMWLDAINEQGLKVKQ